MHFYLSRVCSGWSLRYISLQKWFWRHIMSDTKSQMVDYIFNRVVLILPEYNLWMKLTKLMKFLRGIIVVKEYLVVLRYFCIDLAIEGKMVSAVCLGSIASLPGIWLSLISCRLTWLNASSAASDRRALRFLILRSRSTLKLRKVEGINE